MKFSVVSFFFASAKEWTSMTEAGEGLLIIDQSGSDKGICCHLLIGTLCLEIKGKAEGTVLYLMSLLWYMRKIQIYPTAQ